MGGQKKMSVSLYWNDYDDYDQRYVKEDCEEDENDDIVVEEDGGGFHGCRYCYGVNNLQFCDGKCSTFTRGNKYSDRNVYCDDCIKDHFEKCACGSKQVCPECKIYFQKCKTCDKILCRSSDCTCKCVLKNKYGFNS